MEQVSGPTSDGGISTLPNEEFDARNEIEQLKIAQATQAATMAGAQATQAAAQAGLASTTAATQAGTWSTMVAGGVCLIAGLFLGMTIVRK